MNKLTRMLLMTFVLVVGASLMSCGDIVIGSTDTPAPNPEPTPTPTPKYTYTALTHPLTFEATQPNVIVTFKFKEGATPDYRKVEYSFDGQTWTPLSGPNQPILLANTGDSLMFRGQNPTYNGEASFELIKDTTASARANTRFPLDNQPLALISGNLVSLLKKEFEEKTATELVAENKDAFKVMFKGAKIDVKKGDDGKVLLLLPTTLTNGALMQTFANSLITALELPATVLQKDCYTEICLGCEYLEKIIMLAEELPDNVTVDECLKDMLKDAGNKAEGGVSLVVSGEVAGEGSSSGGSSLTLAGVLSASGADDETQTVYMDDEGKAQTVVLPENVYIKEGYEELTLKVGETLDLTEYIVIEPADATDKSVIWDSDNPDFISVTSGVIKALKAGDAIVMGTLENWKYDDEVGDHQGKNNVVAFTVTVVEDTPTPEPEPEPDPDPNTIGQGGGYGPGGEF